MQTIDILEETSMKGKNRCNVFVNKKNNDEEKGKREENPGQP